MLKMLKSLKFWMWANVVFATINITMGVITTNGFQLVVGAFNVAMAVWVMASPEKDNG